MPAMIFAAGLGTRMGELVEKCPKPLISINDTTLIDHAMSFLPSELCNPKVVNIHYKADMIREHLQDGDVLFSDETARSDPVQTLLSAWQPDRMTALLLLVPVEQALGHLGHGDFLMNDDGSLLRGPGPVYTGIQIIKTEGLSQMPDEPFSMNLYWDAIAKQGGLFGVLFDGKWCDVGRPTSIPLAEKLLSENV